MPPEVLVPIVTTALGGLFGLFRALLKLRAWNQHEKRKAKEAAPSPPPDIGSITALIAVLVGSAIVGYAATPLVMLAPLEAFSPKAKCGPQNCKGRCVGGRCQVAAEPPERAPKPGPTTSADSLVLRSVHGDDPARLDPI